MKKLLTLTALAAAIALGAATVRAATLSNGFNAGTGQPQDIFTVSTQNGIELGLGAQPRGASLPAVVDEGNGTYDAISGTTGSPARALWNFDYSIDTSPTGSGSFTLSQLTATLSVTGPGGLNGSFDALASGLGNSSLLADHVTTSPTTSAQNSENMTFNLFGAPIGFNPNLAGQYTFTLTVDQGTNALATDSINVDVTAVPLPSAAGMGLAMLGVIGGAALLRKKLRTA